MLARWMWGVCLLGLVGCVGVLLFGCVCMGELSWGRSLGRSGYCDLMSCVLAAFVWGNLLVRWVWEVCLLGLVGCVGVLLFGCVCMGELSWELPSWNHDSFLCFSLFFSCSDLFLGSLV